MDESAVPKLSRMQNGLAMAANLVTILVVLGPTVIHWLRSPVTVEVETVQSSIPPYLYTRLEAMTKAFGDPTKPTLEPVVLATNTVRVGDVGPALKDLSDRLLRVRSVQRVILTNGSNSTIKDLTARVPNVWNAEFFAVQCNDCTQAERDGIQASCKFDAPTKHVLIGPVPALPPKAVVSVTVFGEFGSTIVGPPATASYADGEARLVRSEKVEGLTAIVAGMGPFGLVVLAFLFLGHQLLRRAK